MINFDLLNRSYKLIIRSVVIEGILGNINKERCLQFIVARSEGYAREISDFYETSLSPIQNQLDKLEKNNILYSEPKGKTILYKLNPRYPFINELTSLINKTLEFLTEADYEKLVNNRRRPRRKGKLL